MEARDAPAALDKLNDDMLHAIESTKGAAARRALQSACDALTVGCLCDLPFNLSSCACLGKTFGAALRPFE